MPVLADAPVVVTPEPTAPPAATSTIVDTPDQRTAIAQVMAKMGLTPDDLTGMEIPGGTPEASPGEVAEAAASAATSAPSPDVVPAPAAAQAAEPPPDPAAIPTPAQQRAAYLAKLGEASKAERRARAAQKQAQQAQAAAAETAARAAAFQAATQGWEQNPTKLIEAAGINPSDFYRKLTEAALRGDEPPPVDPVEAKVQAAIAPYIKAQQEAAAALESQQIASQELQVKANRVFPILAQKAGEYESLIAAHGGNLSAATDYVYGRIKEHFEATWNPETQTGEQLTVEETAEQLEEWHADQFQAALETLAKTQKYGSKFAQVAAANVAAAAPPPAVVVPATRPAAVPKPTLTAAMNAVPQTAAPARKEPFGPNVQRTAAESPRSYETYSDSRKREINDILKQFGIV